MNGIKNRRLQYYLSRCIYVVMNVSSGPCNWQLKLKVQGN